MNALMTAAEKLALIIFLALPLHAADQTRRLYTEAGSTFTIDGDNSIHTWHAQTKEPRGWIAFDAGFASMAPGKIQATMEGYFSVGSLHISEGLSFDKVMRRLLREETNPSIFYRLLELSLNTRPKIEGDPYIFDSRVELVVAGVTNRILMPLHMIRLGDHRLKISGDTSLKMSDFRIEPLELPVSGSPDNVKYGDGVKIRFEWFVGPKSAMRD